MCMTEFGPFWRIPSPVRLIFTDTVIIDPEHSVLPVVHTTPTALPGWCCTEHWHPTETPSVEEPSTDHSCNSFNAWFPPSVYGLVRLPAALSKRLSKWVEGMLSDRYATSKCTHAVAREFVTTGGEKVIVCATWSFNYIMPFLLQVEMCICNW